MPGERERVSAAGWEVACEPELAEVERALAAAGVAVKAGTVAELAERRVGRLLRFDHPAGNAVEVFCGAARDSMRMAPELFGKPVGWPPLWMRFLGCNPGTTRSRWPRSRRRPGSCTS